MTLITSISGIRGTLGARVSENLTPLDVVSFCSSFGQLLIEQGKTKRLVIGMDGRVSGPSIKKLVGSTLNMMGFDIYDTGLSTTPGIEMEVLRQRAGGGVIITASHNPEAYNALKFLNQNGECISAEDGEKILQFNQEKSWSFSPADRLGKYLEITDSLEHHVDAICSLDLVDAELIRKRSFHIVVDCINSVGALAIPVLLDKLGCTYELLFDKIEGKFEHDPEPLEKNLQSLIKTVSAGKSDLGIAVDPDVDRLAFVDNQGTYCGEEYTLVMIADYVLDETPGPCVSNLSSTLALRRITENKKLNYHASPVGEVNVVKKMKEVKAVIGGEGNGGIIYPALHYGRDALVGIALLLTKLAKSGLHLNEYRKKFPEFVMTKNKIDLSPGLNPEELLGALSKQFSSHETDRQDGLKIYFPEGWVHLRKSNTEPILRLYSEGSSLEQADEYSLIVSNRIRQFI